MASWKELRARHNALTRYRAADDPELLAVRRDLKAARAEDYIRDALASEPPLTASQRERLASILEGK